jgi:hypothetical protein
MSNLNPRQFTVLDFNAARKVKAKTGKGIAIQKTAPESADFAEHANQAISMAPPKKSPAPPRESRLTKVTRMLGLPE